MSSPETLETALNVPVEGTYCDLCTAAISDKNGFLVEYTTKLARLDYSGEITKIYDIGPGLLGISLADKDKVNFIGITCAGILDLDSGETVWKQERDWQSTGPLGALDGSEGVFVDKQGNLQWIDFQSRTTKIVWTLSSEVSAYTSLQFNSDKKSIILFTPNSQRDSVLVTGLNSESVSEKKLPPADALAFSPWEDGSIHLLRGSDLHEYSVPEAKLIDTWSLEGVNGRGIWPLVQDELLILPQQGGNMYHYNLVDRKIKEFKIESSASSNPIASIVASENCEYLLVGRMMEGYEIFPVKADNIRERDSASPTEPSFD